MVRAVLFDLDDTLFDHRASAATALRLLQQAHECFRDVPFDEFEREHSRLLEALHPEVVLGRLGLDEARCERFRRLFDRFGVDADPVRCDTAARMYRSEYLDARRAMAGAGALLAAVRARAPVGIVSNNIRQEQSEKLEHIGLAPHVDVLIVSEEAGVSKPDPAIFVMALDALGAQASDAVMVGDSWSADVMGARAAGIRAVWFNPQRLRSPEPRLGVAELHTLEPSAETLELLLREREKP
jgi:putative hydrolase of the HAD superfamily